MSYFISPVSLTSQGRVEIAGSEARHLLLSRRVKKGELVVLQGPDGKRFSAEVDRLGKDVVAVKVLSELPVPAEPTVNIIIFQAVVAEKALDFIFQKATELGASGIVLFNASRTPARLTVDQFGKKLPRWEKILWEAAKQCDRSRVPGLNFAPDISGLRQRLQECDFVFVCDAAGKNFAPEVLNKKSPPGNIGLVVGPEGGFVSEEVNQYTQLANTHLLNLSPFTLRSETAAIAALAACRQWVTQTKF